MQKRYGNKKKNHKGIYFLEKLDEIYVKLIFGSKFIVKYKRIWPQYHLHNHASIVVPLKS